MQLQVSLDKSSVLEETIAVPVPPSNPKPQGRNASRPRQCQKTAQQVTMLSASQLACTPHGVQAAQSPPCDALTTPTPPYDPPPSTRTNRSRQCLAMPPNETKNPPLHTMLKSGTTRSLSFPPATEMSSSSGKTLTPRIVLKLETTGSKPEVDASKSAMAMDLGDDAFQAAFKTASKPVHDTVTYGIVPASFTKSSHVLPPIMQSTWGGVSTPRGTVRAHDIV